MSAFSGALRRTALAAAAGACLLAIPAAAMACDCYGDSYGSGYGPYYHSGYSGNYSCYGGGYDCGYGESYYRQYRHRDYGSYDGYYRHRRYDGYYRQRDCEYDCY